MKRLKDGVDRLRMGDVEGAIAVARAVLKTNPVLVPALLLLGRALLESGRPADAAVPLRQAVEAAPDLSATRLALARALQGLGKGRETYQHFIRALELEPTSVEVQLQVGQFLMERGQREDAETLLRLAAASGSVAGAAALLDLMERRGALDEAEQLYAQLPAEIHDHLGLRIARARLHHARGEEQDALTLLDAIPSERLPRATRSGLLHLRADVLDALDRPEPAFAAWRAANELQDGIFDFEGWERALEQIRERSPGEVVPVEAPTPRPILIVGMPRSGTSLVEQILASHSAVAGAGELDDLPEIARTVRRDDPEAMARAASSYRGRLRREDPSAAQVSDKLPLNFQHLGLAAQLLPDARVIHCCRDPLDVGLSCFSRAFLGSYGWSTSLAGIGRFSRGYQAMMRHWRAAKPLPMLDVHYEQLVADPETQVRRIFTFLKLPFEPAVLQFHQSGRVVNTASYAQVRRPIYRSSAGKAACYRRWLTPLIEALEGD